MEPAGPDETQGGTPPGCMGPPPVPAGQTSGQGWGAGAQLQGLPGLLCPRPCPCGQQPPRLLWADPPVLAAEALQRAPQALPHPRPEPQHHGPRRPHASPASGSGPRVALTRARPPAPVPPASGPAQGPPSHRPRPKGPLLLEHPAPLSLRVHPQPGRLSRTQTSVTARWAPWSPRHKDEPAAPVRPSQPHRPACCSSDGSLRQSPAFLRPLLRHPRPARRLPGAAPAGTAAPRLTVLDVRDRDGTLGDVGGQDDLPNGEGRVWYSHRASLGQVKGPPTQKRLKSSLV